MKKRFWALAALAAFGLVSTDARAAEVLVCDIPMTAAAAGSASSATGNLRFFGDEVAGTITVEVTHNVAGANGIEIRTGGIGQTGALITNLGGATGTNVTYALTSLEAQSVITSGTNWYIAVNSALFPAPGGAIRADAAVCYSSNPDGEGEAANEGEIPEGLADYTCSLTLNDAQMVEQSGTTATGTGTIEFQDANNATFILQHNIPVNDTGEINLYKGAPGENGTLVRRLGGSNQILFMTFSKAELEDYTSQPHYIIVEALSGDSIRGDILGCEFDDGVVDEGEAEVEGVVEGDGEPVDCLIFEEGEPADLKCSVDLTGSAVVPATTSPFSGGVQITGPIPGDGQFLLVVRHNVTSPTSISLFKGAPGQSGQLFQSFTSNLGCPFVQLLSPNFFQVLGNNPLYVEINSSGDTNATIRGDLICPDAVEGQQDGEGPAEGVVEGDGEGAGTADLSAIADGLLLVFQNADGSQNGLLEFAEASFAAPIMTQDQFLALDDNDDQALSTGELHRYAGPVRKHNGDIDGDFTLDVSELLRLIQLYNAGAYSCVDPAGSTEDGFAPGAAKGDVPACQRHAADYIGGGDFEIDLSELLRVIQLFNFGTYSYCETPSAADDNYCIEGALLFP